MRRDALRLLKCNGKSISRDEARLQSDGFQGHTISLALQYELLGITNPPLIPEIIERLLPFLPKVMGKMMHGHLGQY